MTYPIPVRSLKPAWKKPLSWALCCLFPFACTFSQSLNFRQFTTEDGLPDMTVYHSEQDGEGYMWFGTESGACRFDGQSFKRFSMADGLTGNEVLEMGMDGKGRLWLFPHRSIPCYREGQRFKPYLGIEDAEKTLFLECFLDSRGRFWFSALNHGALRLDTALNLRYCNPGQGDGPPNIQRGMFTTRIEELPNGNVLWCTGDALCLHSEEGGTKTLKLGTGRMFHRRHARMGEYLVLPGSMAEGLYLCEVDLENLDSFRIVQRQPHPGMVNHFFVDRDETLWVGGKSGLFRYRLVGDSLQRIDRHLLGVEISSIEVDSEGNMWLTSLSHGVFLLTRRARSCRIVSASAGSRPAVVKTICRAKGGGVYLGTEDGRISHVARDSRGFLQNRPLPVAPKRRVRGIVEVEPGKIWAIDESLENLIVADHARSERVRFHYMAPKLLVKESAESLLYASNAGVFRLHPPLLDTYKKCGHDILQSSRQPNGPVQPSCQLDQLFDQPTYAIGMAPDSVLYFGTRHGVYVGNGGKSEYLGGLHPFFAFSSTAIACDSTGVAWFGSMGGGIARLEQGRLHRFRASDGLISDLVTSISLEGDSVAWVGTSAGVCRLVWTGNGFDANRVVWYTSWEGLPSGDVNQLLKVGDTLYVATMNGLALIAHHQFEQVPPRTNISRVQINDRDTTLLPHYTLRHTQNFIRIGYSGLYLQNPPSVSYRYRLLPLDEAWHETEESSQSFSRLEPGDYRFEVQAMTERGKVFGETAHILFEIRPALHQKSWFRWLLTGTALTLALLLIWLRIRSVRRRNQLKQQFLEARQLALQSQMSPHFIFNSLNAIQERISSRDFHNANIYLARFGALIRSILQHSQMQTVSLEAEIGFIKEFLEMAVFRFDDSFEYVVEVDEGLELSGIRVPPMLLQPFVENAILHGLMLSKRPGKLRISIRKIGDRVLCAIEDNGIGRELSKEIRARRALKRESIGIKNTTDRIQLFNRLHNGAIDLRIVDLHDAEGNVNGTLVELTLGNTGA